MSTFHAVPRNRLLVGDALARLEQIPDDSVDQVATSPPYFRLRDYGAPAQLGLESHIDEWVDHLSRIASEVGRVLTPTGTLWINVGDTYASHQSQGATPKSLLLGPERLVMRLQADGWTVRNKIVWRKPNAVPTSIADRLNCTYEVVYLLARQRRYFFDLDAIREPHRSRAGRGARGQQEGRADAAWRGPNAMRDNGLRALKAAGQVGHPLGKNPGDVWTIAPGGYRSGHHAIFPLELAQRMVAAGCPEARCVTCRLPWRRRVIRLLGAAATRSTLAPTCACPPTRERGLVLDPFIGSGTTAVAAELLHRDWAGVELNRAFAAAARRRIRAARSSSTHSPGTSEAAA